MKGFSLIILAAFLWALDSLIRYPLLQDGVPAAVLVFYEHVILCLVFTPYFLKNFNRVRATQLEDLFYFIILGVGGSAIATLCFTKAFLYINPSLVILIQKFQPILAVLLARLILGETIRKEFVFWAGLAIAGVFLISFDDIYKGVNAFSEGDAFGSKALKGYVLTFIASLGWGASTVFGKKLSLRGFNEKEIMGGRFLMALLVLTPIVLSGEADLEIDFMQGLKTLGLVLISGLAGMYFYYRGLKYVSARIGTIGELFFPLGAIVLNWVFLGIEVSYVQITGGALLMFAASMIQIKRY